MSEYSISKRDTVSDEDLPTYVELFGNRTGRRLRDYSSSDWPIDCGPNTSTAANETTLFQTDGQFFIFEKGTLLWDHIGSCELKIVQSNTTKEIHVVVARKSTGTRYADHPMPAFKTMRAHNGCSRSRVWSLYTDSSAARDYEKGAVYCFRCHTAEVAQALENAYCEAYEESASSACVRAVPGSPPWHYDHRGMRVLFTARAKLFVIVRGARDWAAQGACKVKFVEDWHDPKAVYLVAERRETRKTCIDHRMPATMTLRTHPACERARLWGLFADALPRSDSTRGPVYCLRFADCDRALAFEKAFKEHWATSMRRAPPASPYAQAVDAAEEVDLRRTIYDGVEDGGKAVPPPKYDGTSGAAEGSTGLHGAPPSYSARAGSSSEAGDSVGTSVRRSQGVIRRVLSRIFRT